LSLLCQSPLCFLIASGQEILRASEILEQKQKTTLLRFTILLRIEPFPLMSPIDFESLFRLLTGYDPFPWQVALFEQFRAGEFPRSASLPTGLGKTSLIVLWILACYAALRDDRRDFPRRLYFVINRRTVVDEATSFAAQALARIQAASTPELAEMKNVFRGAAAFDEEKCIGLSTLRGEFADNEEWRVDPSRPAITIGTIDKIGSKLLFAGYGDTPYTRPTAAALTAISSYVVYDEAHLEPAFSALLESIKQLIDREPTSQEPARFGSFHFTELTATPREGTGFQLTQEDHQSEKVQQRIHARKTLTLIPDNNNLTATICAQALQFKDQAKKILVYVNSPEDAFQLFDELNQKKNAPGRVALLTGTIRGFERDLLAEQDPNYRLFLQSDQAVTESIYLVSTSAGEVGADFDADHLVTENTSLDALIQRLGRLNRRGRTTEACAIVVANAKALADEQKKKTAAETKAAQIAQKQGKKKAKSKNSSASGDGDDTDPNEEDQEAVEQVFIPPEPLACTIAFINSKLTPDGTLDVSPAHISTLIGSLSEQARQHCFSSQADTLPLTEKTLNAYAQTTIPYFDLGVPKPEIYLHGRTEAPAETTVVWRGEVELFGKYETDEELLKAYYEKNGFRSFERLTDSAWRVREKLTKLARKPPIQTDPSIYVLRATGEVSRYNLSDFKNGRPNLTNCTLILPPSLGALSPAGFFDPAEPPKKELPYDLYAGKPGQETRTAWLLRQNDDEEEEGYLISSLLEPDSQKAFATKKEATDFAAKQLGGSKHAVLATPLDDQGSYLINIFCAISENIAIIDQAIYLDEHLAAVEVYVSILGRKLSLPSNIQRALRFAARQHDPGKDHPLWRRFAGANGKALAKPVIPTIPAILKGYRHEFGSLIKTYDLFDDEPERDLILHLIAEHHGYGRPFFKPNAIDPDSPPDKNDTIYADSILRYQKLTERFGRYNLAFLGSLLRAADAKASRDYDQPIPPLAELPERSPLETTVTIEPTFSSQVEVTVNRYNIANVFGAIGLLAVADKLYPGSQGKFTNNSFLIRIPRSEVTITDLTQFFFGLEISQNYIGSERIAPIHLGNQTPAFTIDYLLDQTRERDRPRFPLLTLGARSQFAYTYKDMVKRALEVTAAEQMDQDLFDISVNTSTKLNLDPRSLYGLYASNDPFSANELQYTVSAYPISEAFCALGLSLCPALDYDNQTRQLRYSTFSVFLPLSIATVAIVDAYQLQGSERFTLVSEERGKLVGLTHSRTNPA
jgi:CRISPR-associated endonuclease/helicase Cas3